MIDEYRKLKIFAWVEADAISEVLRLSEKEFFKEWRLIIYEGERIDNKGYIILSGEVKIQLQQLEIATLWEWEIFWEMWLIMWEKRKATVRASKDTETLVIDFDKLMTLIDHDENMINKEVIRRMEANIIMEE
jgi:CRP-like cAMP-binding protein